jgi:hypothetical protein
VRLIHSLDDWGFEPHKLPDEEVYTCCIILFEALFRIRGMQDAVGREITLKQISSLVAHLRQIYRLENPYHNFEHALDVLQALYVYLRDAKRVPSVSILLNPTLEWDPHEAFDPEALVATLTSRDLFTIYIAAIGHDVAHPGFTNNFMVCLAS